MKTTRTFKLERPARKSGGDRYEEQLEKGQEPMMGSTYVNQSISRPSGKILESLEITIETSD